jgi:hypothetical protein
MKLTHLVLFSVFAFQITTALASELNADLVAHCKAEQHRECSKLLEACEKKDAKSCFELGDKLNQAGYDADAKALYRLAYIYKK